MTLGPQCTANGDASRWRLSKLQFKTLHFTHSATADRRHRACPAAVLRRAGRIRFVGVAVDTRLACSCRDG